MWWSERPTRRAALALAGAGLLSGCFRPMLATGGRAEALSGRVALPQVAGRGGYHLVRRLEDRLGRPGPDPAFRLVVDLELRERGLAIAQDRAITRRTVTAEAQWRLVASGAGEGPVLSGREIAESGYNETGALYATDIARRDIERRLVEELAERIARSVQARAPEAE